MPHLSTLTSLDRSVDVPTREAFPAVPSPSPVSDIRATTLAEALRQGLLLQRAEQAPRDVSAVTVRGQSIGRINLVEATGGALVTATQPPQGVARVAALVQLEGSATVRQGERVAALNPGDLCLIRSARPMELNTPGQFRIALVEAPEDEFADRFPLWRAALLTPIRGNSGVPAVFCDAVKSLHRWRESLDDAGGEGLADAVVDLMGALVCFAVPVNRDCLRQSLLQKERIKKVAQLNLRNPDLDVDFIAAAVGLSVRQVHRLFADEGMSVMRWVWVQRLEQCRRELSREDAGGRPISDIAYEWGFNDQAHFSRAFRKQFGLPPRDLRRNSGGKTLSDALTPSL